MQYIQLVYPLWPVENQSYRPARRVQETDTRPDWMTASVRAGLAAPSSGKISCSWQMQFYNYKKRTTTYKCNITNEVAINLLMRFIFLSSSNVNYLKSSANMKQN